jgi:Mrp family chromosome partitioning ATPase/uncharacterized protein involved in exopolysaccharide biosynthesis
VGRVGGGPSGPAGAGAMTLGKSTYETSTLMLYKAGDVKEEAAKAAQFSTQIQMVKIPPNLEAVTERLGLPVAAKEIGKACEVVLEKKTSLVTITVKWTSGKIAAAIANTLRDVFLESQVNLVKSEAKRKMKELEARFAKVEESLTKASANLEQFVSENKIVDLAKDIQWNQDRLTSLELLSFNSRTEKDAVESQKASLLERVAALDAQVAAEKKGAAQSKGLGDLNIRIERLRRAIHDDREQRKNEVGLDKFKQAYERAQELYKRGLISQKEFESAKADYETQEIKTLETEQITEWKRQLKALEEAVIPPKEEFKSPTQELVQNLQVKAMDLELRELSLKKKVAYLNEEMARIKARIETLTNLQRRYAALSKEVSTREAEKSELEQMLAKVRRDYETTESGFITLSPAPVPKYPVKSNKKIIFAVVVFLGGLLGFSAILGLELLDTTIKSASELQSKVSAPVLGVIPSAKVPEEIWPDEENFPLIEMFRIISRRVRRDIPKRGARIIITSADQGEGKTLVTANLAACLGRQDERALVLDAQIRSVSTERDLRYLISERDKPLKGLGEWLSFETDDIDEIVWPTVFAGVECIPRVKEAVIPDLLGSMRMKELMDELSRRFTLILIDGPSVADHVDVELAAQWCDAVILVVRSRVCSSASLKRAVERVRGVGAPLAFLILNDVDKIYLKWA